MSPLTRRGATHSVAGSSNTADDDETALDMVEESLMQLIVSVPYTRDEDIPICMRFIPAVVGVALRDSSAKLLVSSFVTASTTMMSSHHVTDLF